MRALRSLAANVIWALGLALLTIVGAAAAPR
jgi:hypothetical protein